MLSHGATFQLTEGFLGRRVPSLAGHAARDISINQKSDQIIQVTSGEKQKASEKNVAGLGHNFRLQDTHGVFEITLFHSDS